MTLSRCGDTGSVLDLRGENMVLGNTRPKSQTYRLLLGLYVCCCECIFAITLESQFKIYHVESLVPGNPLLNRWHRQCGRYSSFFTFIPGVCCTWNATLSWQVSILPVSSSKTVWDLLNFEATSYAWWPDSATTCCASVDFYISISLLTLYKRR